MAQKQTSGIDWLRALTNSICHAQPPLNHGTRYAVAVRGQLPGAVTGNAIAALRVREVSVKLIPTTEIPSSDGRGPSLIELDTAMAD